MHPARQPRGRRTLVHAALAGLLTTIVFALAQCTMVEDQLTNVDPFRGQGNECIRRCNQAFRESLKVERRLHRRNLRACGVRDDDDDRDRDRDRDHGDDAPAAAIAPGGGAAGTASEGRGTEAFRGRGDHGDDDDRDHDRDRGDRDDGDRDDDGEDDHGDEGDDEDGEGDDGGDHGGDRKCVRLENQRHRAAVERIEAGRRECIRDCHHQGGGIGG
jgi:hypothetical protein